MLTTSRVPGGMAIDHALRREGVIRVKFVILGTNRARNDAGGTRVAAIVRNTQRDYCKSRRKRVLNYNYTITLGSQLFEQLPNAASTSTDRNIVATKQRAR